MKAIYRAMLIASAIPGAASASQAARPADPNVKVCRPTDSLNTAIPRVTCHSRATWQQIDKANQIAARGGLDFQATVGRTLGH